jgi:hypothetical protein
VCEYVCDYVCGFVREHIYFVILNKFRTCTLKCRYGPSLQYTGFCDLVIDIGYGAMDVLLGMVPWTCSWVWCHGRAIGYGAMDVQLTYSKASVYTGKRKDRTIWI